MLLGFKEPLRQIFIVSRHRPFVIVDVEFLLPCLPFSRGIFWWLLFARLSFSRLRLLLGLWFFQHQFLFLHLLALWFPDAHIANLAKIFLDPVQIFTCNSFLLVAMVADNNIAFL